MDMAQVKKWTGLFLGGVLAFLAVEGVVAVERGPERLVVAKESVVARAAGQPVAAPTTVDRVVPGLAGEQVGGGRQRSSHLDQRRNRLSGCGRRSRRRPSQRRRSVRRA